jgi:hypothetical protein
MHWLTAMEPELQPATNKTNNATSRDHNSLPEEQFPEGSPTEHAHGPAAGMISGPGAPQG